MRPQLLYLAELRHPGNAADRADHAGEGTRGVGAAREAEDVDFIRGLLVGVAGIVSLFSVTVVEGEKGESALDIALHASAEHTAEDLVQQAAAAHAGVVVDDLLGAVLGLFLYRLPDPHHIGGLVRVL